MLKTVLRTVGFVIVLIALTSCASSTAVLTKHSLDVRNQMSNSIFLQPVSPSQKVVYVGVHNTSDQPTLNGLGPVLKQDLIAEGYKVTNDPRKAHYILQVNILRAGKQEPGAMQNVVTGSVGGAVVGAGAGLIGGHGNGTDIAIGALSGAVAGTVLDSLVHNVTYTVLTNIQIQERLDHPMQQADKSVIQQGTNSTSVVTSNQVTNWNTYRTRMVSTAQRVNLSFEKASPMMIASMSQSISGIF